MCFSEVNLAQEKKGNFKTQKTKSFFFGMTKNFTDVGLGEGVQIWRERKNV